MRRPFGAAWLLSGSLAMMPPTCGGGGDPPITGPDGNPVRAELLGMNIDPQNPTADPAASTLTDLGVSRLRFTFRADADLQSAFTSYDPVIAAYRSAGLGVLLIIDGETLAPPDLPVNIAGTDAWINYIGAFADRAQKIAAHYDGQIDAFEIWNEEDLDDSLPGRHIDPGPYAQILDETYDRIHQVTGTQVLVGGLASGDTGYLDGMGSFRADGIATHPYLHWPGDGVPSGWFSLADHIRAYSAYWKPLWFTEWGTNDQSLQADLIKAFFSHPEITSNVAAAYFFGWSDTQDPGYGITTDGTNYKEPLRQAFGDAGMRSTPPGPDGSHGVVRGTVHDASTGAVVGTGVTLYCAGQETPVRADGTFEIDRIPPSVYGISAVNNFGNIGAYDVWASTVNVNARQVTNVDVQLSSAQATSTATGSVRGTVYDASTGTAIHPRDPGHAAGITIYCAGLQAQLADDGTYEIDGIPAGDYGIAAVNNYNQANLYGTWKWSVTITAGQTEPLDVYMIPN
jgi:hypothetical protein